MQEGVAQAEPEFSAPAPVAKPAPTPVAKPAPSKPAPSLEDDEMFS